MTPIFDTPKKANDLTFIYYKNGEIKKSKVSDFINLMNLQYLLYFIHYSVAVSL